MGGWVGVGWGGRLLRMEVSIRRLKPTVKVIRMVGLLGFNAPQQPGSYQGGEMMMMKSVLWWRKPEYPEETTDLRQVTDETNCHLNQTF